MTRRAATPAVIAGMIVRAGKGQDRIEQACFLQAEKNRIRAKFRAEAAVTELVVRLAGIFRATRIADFCFLVAAAFENAENIAGLRNFPTIQRIELGNYALRACLFGRSEERRVGKECRYRRASSH